MSAPSTASEGHAPVAAEAAATVASASPLDDTAEIVVPQPVLESMTAEGYRDYCAAVGRLNASNTRRYLDALKSEEGKPGPMDVGAKLLTMQVIVTMHAYALTQGPEALMSPSALAEVQRHRTGAALLGMPTSVGVSFISFGQSAVHASYRAWSYRGADRRASDQLREWCSSLHSVSLVLRVTVPFCFVNGKRSKTSLVLKLYGHRCAPGYYEVSRVTQCRRWRPYARCPATLSEPLTRHRVRAVARGHVEDVCVDAA